MSRSKPQKWVLVPSDPPTAVDGDGVVWLVCPVKGPDCARIERSRYSAQMGEDVMSIHVQVKHRPFS